MTQEESSETAAPGRQLSARDLDRFNTCVLPYLDAAHNLARHLLRHDGDAEDAVQDAFLRAIRHFSGFRGADGRAWLLAIVRNTCFTRLRVRRAAGESVEFDEEQHSAEGASRDPAAELARRAAARTVRDGLERLPVEFREVVVLRELEGLSYKEIAEVCGVPIGTVMSRLARGRRQLLEALSADAPKEGG